MKQNDLEKLFRDRLSADRPQVNTDQLWSSLEGHLPSGKKRQPFFIWWLTGIAIPILVTAALWFNGSLSHEDVSTKTQGPQSNIQHNVPIKPENAQQDIPSEIYQVDTDQQIMGKGDFKLPLDQKNNIGSQNKNTESGHASMATIDKNDSETQQEPTETVDANHKKSNPNSRATLTNKSGTTDTKISDENSTGIKANREMLDKLASTKHTIISKLPSMNIPLYATTITTVHQLATHQLKHELSFSAGIGITSRQLDGLNIEGHDEKEFRSTTEKVLENWSAALTYRYHPGHWFVEASLSGGWFNEKVDATTVTLDTLTLSNVVIEQVMENGQMIEERRGQATIYERTERRIVNYPQLFHLQGGVGLGRSWAINKNASLLTRGGMLYSFYNQYRGTIAIAPDQFYDLDRDGDNRFTDDGMRFGGYLALDIRRQLSPQWSVLAGLQASLWLGGFSREKSPVHQQYQSYSFTLGLSRHF